jgi:hypothetical protein
VWSVRVLKSQPVEFPPICVGCGGEPSSHFEIREDAVGWWSVVRFGWIYGKATGRSVKVPACTTCAVKLRSERRRRKVIESVVIFAAVGLCLFLFRELDGLAQRLAVLGLAMVFALPWLIWDVMHPMPVEITVTDAAVTFQFTDKAYAQQFASKNT